MSGGHFDYAQHHIERIADEIETLLHNERDSAEPAYDFLPQTLAEFQRAIPILRQAYIYAQRIDWLVSGDDGEDTFHKRLKADLEKL